MELMLMKEDLWSIVKDAKPEPENLTSAWRRKDERAKAMIGLTLEDSQLTHIMESTTAKEMWDRLKGYHERGSLSNKIHVLRKLCSMRLSEDGSMSDHLLQATELVHRLNRLGESLKEHMTVAILLSSLPESYNPLVTALEGRPEEDLKLDYVKGKLLDEWRRKCEARKDDNVQEQAMKCRVPPEVRKKVRVCYYCGMEGHFRWNCPVLLDDRQARSKKLAEAKSAVHPRSVNCTGSDQGVCFTMKSRDDVSTRGKWILDTGCTRHITNSLTRFYNRGPCDVEIFLADGRNMKARESGQGRIFGRGMGNVSVAINLKELLYVPGLPASILSVSRITDEGYSVVFEPRKCKILDGNSVIAVGEKSGGLYYLKE